MNHAGHARTSLLLNLKFQQNLKANPVRIAGEKIQLVQAYVNFVVLNLFDNFVQSILDY